MRETEDDNIKKMLRDDPLLTFSLYTQIQTDVVRRLGTEIIVQLDTWFTSEGIIATSFNEVYGKFWMWVLCSYEIIRTMKSARECFADEIANEIQSFHDHIVHLRIPFAKQEYRGKERVFIKGEASVYGIDQKTRSLLFEVKGEIFNSREMIERFDTLMGTLIQSDVIADLRTSK